MSGTRISKCQTHFPLADQSHVPQHFGPVQERHPDHPGHPGRHETILSFSSEAKVYIQKVNGETKTPLWWLSNAAVLASSAAYAKIRQAEMRQEHQGDKDTRVSHICKVVIVILAFVLLLLLHLLWCSCVVSLWSLQASTKVKDEKRDPNELEKA